MRLGFMVPPEQHVASSREELVLCLLEACFAVAFIEGHPTGVYIQVALLLKFSLNL